MQAWGKLLRTGLIATSLLCLPAISALAQDAGPGAPNGSGCGMPPRGGGMPGGPQGDMPGGRGGFPPDGRGGPPPNGFPGGGRGGMRGVLQLGPPGRWWDDSRCASELHLRPDQQKRMDAIFDENRSKLLSSFQSLHQEEAKMESLVHADSPDEGALFAEIDRMAQARASLEKVNAHYLLLIRKEMDPDQIARLESHR